MAEPGGPSRAQEPARRRRWRAAHVLVVAALAACSPEQGAVPGHGAMPAAFAAEAGGLPLMRMPEPGPAPPPRRPNAEMAQDILDLAFRMESGREIPALGRFEGPVRVRIAGHAPPTLDGDLEALLGRLRAEAGLDVALTSGRDAEIVVETVPAAEIARAMPGAACFVVPNALSWDEFLELRGTAALDWPAVVRRERAAVFVPADASPQELRDCLHEELGQALGPLNDLYRLPDSVFNDDNIHAVLTGFDMLVLRTLHDPALAAGMSRAEVAARLPEVLARLNPGGERPARATGGETPRDWVAAIETALSPQQPDAKRREAARQAVALTRAHGWTGARSGFALYALGRIEAAGDAAAALRAFEAAGQSYDGPDTAIHRAHVDVQLAAFALASGDPARVLALAGRAVPVAEAHGNAGLLATLLFFRAEALALTGREAAARSALLDGLAWARYGFGSPEAARGRLAEVQALNPFRSGA